MDMRQQVAAAPKVTPPLVDTRTIGKAPTFIGEPNDWPEWSFQFTAYKGSANSKSIEALCWLRCKMPRSQPQRSCNRVLRSTMLNCTWPWYCCQRKRMSNSKENQSQPWTESVARIERYV